MELIVCFFRYARVYLLHSREVPGVSGSLGNERRSFSGETPSAGAERSKKVSGKGFRGFIGHTPGICGKLMSLEERIFLYVSAISREACFKR
jgi:hypothetical protein